MISTTYHKYSKFFIENIPSSSVLCFENLLKEFFNLDSEVFVDCSYFFFSVMKNCAFVFERNQVFFLKTSKFLRIPTQQGLLFFSEIFRMRSPLKYLKKVLRKLYFFRIDISQKTKQKKKTKKTTESFLGIATYNLFGNLQEKHSKPTLVGASESLRFSNKSHCFCKEQEAFLENDLLVFFSAEPL